MAVLATDNFNRANNTDIGASWDVMTGEDPLGIISNQCGVIANNRTSDRTESNNSVTWPNDQYSQVTFVVCAVTGGANDGVGIGPAIRMATGARTYYRMVCAGPTSNGTELAKFVAASYTTLANSAQSWVNTDTAYVEAQGTAIKCKRNSTQIISVTDASIASGRAGIAYSSPADNADILVDNWEGGDFSGGAATVFQMCLLGTGR